MTNSRAGGRLNFLLHLGYFQCNKNPQQWLLKWKENFSEMKCSCAASWLNLDACKGAYYSHHYMQQGCVQGRPKVITNRPQPRPIVPPIVHTSIPAKVLRHLSRNWELSWKLSQEEEDSWTNPFSHVAHPLQDSPFSEPLQKTRTYP